MFLMFRFLVPTQKVPKLFLEPRQSNSILIVNNKYKHYENIYTIIYDSFNSDDSTSDLMSINSNESSN